MGVILIVDDEKPMRFMVRRLVENLGHTAFEAGTGEEALAALAQNAADLVITDMKMPGMDGLTLAKQLIEEDPDRPVLMMTAYADLESARRAVAVGVYEYFIKPFDVNDVMAGIRRGLERRELVLENRAYQRDLERKVEERTRELKQRMRELEARDKLLRHLLSIQEPEETLGLAVTLALDLCGCDIGALYVPDAEGNTPLRAAVGFTAAGETAAQSELDGLGLDRTPEAVQALAETLENHTPVWVHDPGPIRSGFGVHSFGVLPVSRGDQVIALFEIGRKRKDALVGEADLEALAGFMPYVAMAVNDCMLHEQMSEWEGDVQGILEQADEWTE